MAYRTTLAACYWSPYLALVVMQGKHVIAIQRVRVATQTLGPTLRRRLRRLIDAHRVGRAVAEPKLLQHIHDIGLMVEPWSIGEAKHRLHFGHCSHRRLLQHLADQHQAFQRFVTRRATGRQTFTEPWRNVALIGIALALSAQTTNH